MTYWYLEHSNVLHIYRECIGKKHRGPVSESVTTPTWCTICKNCARRKAGFVSLRKAPA